MLGEEASDAHQQTLFPSEESSEPLLERFRTLLQVADIGIVDMRAEKGEADNAAGHLIYLKHKTEFDNAWLPLREESQGTRTLFNIALPMLQAIQDGGILLVDELERSLHPSLARQIIHQFNDPAANPKNAQIIFTTHDTNLLGTTLGERRAARPGLADGKRRRGGDGALSVDRLQAAQGRESRARLSPGPLRRDPVP